MKTEDIHTTLQKIALPESIPAIFTSTIYYILAALIFFSGIASFIASKKDYQDFAFYGFMISAVLLSVVAIQFLVFFFKKTRNHPQKRKNTIEDTLNSVNSQFHIVKTLSSFSKEDLTAYKILTEAKSKTAREDHGLAVGAFDKIGIMPIIIAYFTLAFKIFESKLFGEKVPLDDFAYITILIFWCVFNLLIFCLKDFRHIQLLDLHHSALDAALSIKEIHEEEIAEKKALDESKHPEPLLVRLVKLICPNLR